MIDGIKRSGIKCEECGFMLLVVGDRVFCQECGKEVRPK